MLATIQSFIESAFNQQRDQDTDKSPGLQSAAAALMVEIAAADFNRQPEERGAIGKALQSCFGLAPDDVQSLIAEAEQHQQDAVSLYEFTSIINERCSQEEKFEILVNLWRIAFADGHLDKYEDHRIRRIAELLNLSHREFIQAKHRVNT